MSGMHLPPAAAGIDPPLPEGTLFQAALVPRRSLSPRGLKLVLALFGLISIYVTTVFWLLGAWPVIGFSGVEVGIAIALIRLHGRTTHECELVLLSEGALRIVRTDARGRRQERVLAPAWLNVRLQERRGRVPALLLVARETREEIGAQLGEAEKRDLARALAEALHRLRNPRFDNPQLRA
jgi:uncharacterized membrane protein